MVDPHPARADSVVLDGHSLTLDAVLRVAEGSPVRVDPRTAVAMRTGRAVIERYFSEGIPAYGLTTGLGMRAGELLGAEAAAAFSYRTVRGRVQALGALLAPEAVRAIMAVRLNTILTGEAGASPAIAECLATALNSGFVAAMPRVASIGTGDLVAMASLAHALIGEGEAIVDGDVVAASDALRALGLEALVLAPKDGVVLCNNTSFSVALSALASVAARRCLDALQLAGALSMEAFGANLTPLRPSVLRARPQPGQVEAGDRLHALLADGPLGRPGGARRLQDPLSFRCIAQVHGAALAALADLDACVGVELNAASDNPLVLLDEGECVSTGNFHLSRLSQTLDTVSRALAWCANDSVSRVHRLMNATLTELPALLTAPGADHAGFGPILKPLEALRAEIIHLATPVPILSSHNADGVEDAATFAPLAVSKLEELLARMALLIAIELVAAAQALELRDRPDGSDHVASRVLGRVHAAVRERCAFVDDDRPLGRDIEAIAMQLVANGRLGEIANVTRT